jgi:hypothetical protein
MTAAPGFRAVVFALRDLSASDKKHIADVAEAVGWPPTREPLLWDTPLLLTRQSHTPPVPGLRTDAEVAASGPSVLLLAMRLLLADALFWPELRFLGIERERDAMDYVLYAADPARWRPETLAEALAPATAVPAGPAQPAIAAACWQIQRGLAAQPERLPAVPGDRVPVLGYQVPMFGGRVRDLRDLRRPDRSLRATLPAGALPGHHQGRYALYLQIPDPLQDPHEPRLRPLETDGQATADEVVVHLTLYRVDTAAGTCDAAALRLCCRDPSRIEDAEAGALTPVTLSDWLSELLPSCFLVAPTGEVLLLDWFHLDLSVRPDPTAPSPAFGLRACGMPGVGAGATPDDPDDSAPAEEADPSLLDPAMWSLAVYADLIAAAELTLSARGRYLLLESSLPVDGELVNLAALLDTAAAGGPQALVCSLVEDDAAPPARAIDDVFPILRGAQAAPGLIA